MVSKIKARVIPLNGFSPEVVNFSKGAVLYEKNPSHLHKFKVQPIPDGNRAERRAAKKLKKK